MPIVAQINKEGELEFYPTENSEILKSTIEHLKEDAEKLKHSPLEILQIRAEKVARIRELEEEENTLLKRLKIARRVLGPLERILKETEQSKEILVDLRKISSSLRQEEESLKNLDVQFESIFNEQKRKRAKDFLLANYFYPTSVTHTAEIWKKD